MKYTSLKKILSLLLVLLMCFSLLPAQAFADDLPEGEAGAEEYIPEPAPEVPEHEHTYTAAVTEPTCSEQGYTTYTCECGYSYVDDYIDPLPHVREEQEEVLPEIGRPGRTAGVVCSVCGEILEGCEVIPALEIPKENYEDEEEITIQSILEDDGEA